MTYDTMSNVTIMEKAQDAETVKELQQQFLRLGLHEDHTSEVEDIDEDTPEGHYEFEAIIGHRGPKHCREYLVKWVGYDESHNSWLSPKRFDDPDAIAEYEASIKKHRK